ncbi:MAG TPA: universal stress protein [Gemmataceae bacterium]|nr:universal stress protein [Gemmataceae bacterium]
MLAFHTILCPTDFSERSASAFYLACSLARDHGARLVVLHVDRPPQTHGEVVARRDGGYREQLEEALRGVRPTDPRLSVEHRLEEGEPAETILRVSNELGCDLIVMGTHGRTGLRRVLMGSVAEQVVRRAACPVLTVNAPLPQAAEPPQPAAHAR